MGETEAEVLVAIEGPVAWVVVNRPAARNALNLAVWRGLAEHLRHLGANRDVRVVVIRGAGETAFLAGADITEFPATRADAAMTASYDRETVAALTAIVDIDKPVIAMVNGLCFGGGCSVALACDLRFAAEHARFAVPAVRLGLAYPFEHGVERLVQVVGPTHAADMLLSGRPVSAAEALLMGLVNRVTPGDTLEATTREYAVRVAEGAPLTIAAHKAAIHEALRAAPLRNAARMQTFAERCFDSADYQEGVAAFLAKRKPAFKGK